MTTAELKTVLEGTCRKCKGRERCLVPECQGLADAITTAVEGAVRERVEKAEEVGPELLNALKSVIEWLEAHPSEISRVLIDEANSVMAKAEGRA